ncbi:hypothetical protein [Rhodococcus koreensis]|uniref:hypothetical protein n=1 Tax=Rhodococcus koreensis TaxID=99653 RepID=UPI00198174BC|nr:hypothetical protein [Rhodococcus koreensis]QSE86996.1 hypothetical protein JWS14_49375 [Rhodococcus koreensis]
MLSFTLPPIPFALVDERGVFGDRGASGSTAGGVGASSIRVASALGRKLGRLPFPFGFLLVERNLCEDMRREGEILLP